MSKGKRMFHRAIEIADNVASLCDLEIFAHEEHWENCLESDCLEYHENGCGDCPLECFFRSLDSWRREDEIEMLNHLKIK